jgi:putative aldouronate transport system permease protein
MWGLRMAFYKYNIFKGFPGSKFVGFGHFIKFFKTPDFWKVTRNTMILGLQGMFINFPITVLFALLLNEVRYPKFKKVTQTISYLPHFLSTVVIIGIFSGLLDPASGIINHIIEFFGGEPIYFMTKTEWYRPLWLITGLWQGIGWGTIVYLAAISGIDPGLYEAARLDGAGRWRQMWSITLPSIAPTVATMWILRVGNIMDASLEKSLLMQVPSTYEVSQVISSFVYLQGFGYAKDYGYAAAIGLFSNLINIALLFLANWASKKVTDSGVF